MNLRAGGGRTRQPAISAVLAGALLLFASGCGGHGPSSHSDNKPFAVVGLNIPGSSGKRVIGMLSADGSTFAASVPNETNWYLWSRSGGWRDTGITSGTMVAGDAHLSSNGKSLLVNTVSGPYLYADGSSGPFAKYQTYDLPTISAFSSDGHRALGATAYTGRQTTAGTFVSWTDGASPVAIPGPFPIGDGIYGDVYPTAFGADGVSIVGYTNVFKLAGGGGFPYPAYAYTLNWSIKGGIETDLATLTRGPAAVSPNGGTFAQATVNGGFVWDLSGSARPFDVQTKTDADIFATAIDDAGDVVAGKYLFHDGLTTTPWIWDAVHGFRLAADVISANGLSTQLQGLTPDHIVGLSANGKTMVIDVVDASSVHSLAFIRLGGA